ncbi:hypothetical protein GCM10009828_098870 [Actinoplanes couchii]|uniref:Uncharacterized protein n=1 Tax=Actinoplanes couchii TaxID=403638 RepID=A0ABQ3XPJ2_9ACTN|nr:hypothetical protein Aco03nite_088360 [Actinoplanes couchii]
MIPDVVGEPIGLTEDSRTTRAWAGELPPADPSAADLAQVVSFASAAVYSRLRGADRVVRGWPAGFRRLAAMKVHLEAVERWHADCAPDEAPARLMPVLIDDRIRGSRSDLAWALRTADGYGLYDGAAHLLPGFIAASLSPAAVADFEPALRAVFADVVTQRSTPRPVRRLLGERYGTAIWRITGRLPLDLLPRHDPFGACVRDLLGERLDEPGAAEVLRHAASLTTSSPTRAWLRAGGAFTPRWPVTVVLGLFAEYRGHVFSTGDQLLRGLVWMLSQDPSGEATTLLGRVAVAAGPAGGHRPVAPQTAAAAAKVLAVVPARTA